MGTKNFRSILNEANGIIIVSGPNGSGKSTTLASALREKILENEYNDEKIRLNMIWVTISNSSLLYA